MNLVKVSYKPEHGHEQSLTIIGDVVNQDNNEFKLWPYIQSKGGGEYKGVVDKLMVVEKSAAQPLEETSLFEAYMEYADTVLPARQWQDNQPQTQLQQQTT